MMKKQSSAASSPVAHLDPSNPRPHSPPRTRPRGWLSFTVRNQSSLPAGLREVAILCVAAILDSKYEVNERTLYTKHAGVSDQVLKEISEEKQMKDGKALNEEQRAVVSYTEAMTIDIVVSDEVFEGARKFLDDKQVIELMATVVAINCAARFLKALDVGEFEGK